ncbi:winged helix-turn-helix domain-containing protein, partial [Muribaculum intestinale]
MNIDTIGYNAGLVWNALNEVEAIGLVQLRKVTKLKDKELMLALGWLARE